LEGFRLRGDERQAVTRRIWKRFLGCSAIGVSGKKGFASKCDFGLKARESARGEIGVPDESAQREEWNRDGFEGERDRERRICWRDEGISMP
jgi:hypothetical protein